MSGGVRDVHVSGSAFINCSTGIRVKSGRPRGGYVQHIVYEGALAANLLLARRAARRHVVVQCVCQAAS
eukprot:COSAG01_NODE_15428_length_1338_cov_1.624697_1_plen_69_part_00